MHRPPCAEEVPYSLHWNAKAHCIVPLQRPAKMLRKLLTPLLLLALPAAVHAETLNLQGSDLLEGVIMDVVAAYQARHPDAQVNVDMTGSVVGRTKLSGGTVDLAILAMPDGQAGASEGMVAVPFAFDVLTIQVNEENPLKELSIPAIESIYGTRSNRSFTKWGDLGLEGAWATRSISAHAPDANHGIYRSMFGHMILNGGPLKPGVAEWAQSAQLLDIVGQDGAAIAVVPGNATTRTTRALFIARKEGDYAYPPTEDSIYYGDYPLRLPFLIVYPEGSAAKVKDFVAFLLDDEAATLLRQAGLVPVPQSERRSLLMQ